MSIIDYFNKHNELHTLAKNETVHRNKGPKIYCNIFISVIVVFHDTSKCRLDRNVTFIGKLHNSRSENDIM